MSIIHYLAHVVVSLTGSGIIFSKNSIPSGNDSNYRQVVGSEVTVHTSAAGCKTKFVHAPQCRNLRAMTRMQGFNHHNLSGASAIRGHDCQSWQLRSTSICSLFSLFHQILAAGWLQNIWVLHSAVKNPANGGVTWPERFM